MPSLKIIIKATIIFYLLYFAFQILFAQDFYQFAQVDYLKNVNIAFHEAGHTLFALFGDFLRTLGGSFLQVFVPLILAVYFFIWRNEIFSGGMMLFWMGESIIDVSWYIADAQKTLLPLLGNPDGGREGHDWHYLLNAFGALDKTDAIAGAAFAFAGLIFLCAFLAMAYSIYLDFVKTDKFYKDDN